MRYRVADLPPVRIQLERSNEILRYSADKAVYLPVDNIEAEFYRGFPASMVENSTMQRGILCSLPPGTLVYIKLAGAPSYTLATVVEPTDHG